MKRSEDRSTPETRADGGEVGGIEEIFGPLEGETTVRLTRQQRIRRTLDMAVFAPARIAWSDWRTRSGILIVTFYVLMGTVGVSLADQPQTYEFSRFLPPLHDGWVTFDPVSAFGLTLPWWPNLHAPLGTDGFGQALGEQIIHSTPAMLKMMISGAVLASGIATVVGTAAGYKGGAVDRVLMFATDIMLTIPGLPLIIVLAAIFEPSDPFVVGFLLAIDNWPGLARSLRSQVLTMRQESYVEASRTMGFSTPSILRRDIVPQLMPYVLINAAGAARGVIFESVGLYFLGILPFTTFNWGVMLNQAYGADAITYVGYLHWLIWPMVAIMGVSGGLILLSQGMDRVFNPRIRARHAKTIDDDGTAESKGN